MRSEEQQGYKWIAHGMCFFAKYHVLWPMKNNSPEDIADGLKRYVFAYFGSPKIFYVDIGVGFKNETIESLLQQWPGISFI